MHHKWFQGLCTKNSQWYSQTEGNDIIDMLNRCDFRCALKVKNVPDRNRSTGRLFQARGQATARARSPMVELHIACTRTSAVDAERSRRRESTSDSGWINSDRYCGAAPFRQRCTTTQSLYWMRSGTRSQCRFTSSGVTWLNLRASAVSRAAAFSMDWIRSRSRCGNVARATLQLSILDMMNDVTNINSASRGSEWQMQRNCLRMPKHQLTSRVRWASIDMSQVENDAKVADTVDWCDWDGADCQLVGWKLVTPSRWYVPHELGFCNIQLESISEHPAGHGAHTIAEITTVMPNGLDDIHCRAGCHRRTVVHWDRVVRRCVWHLPCTR